MVRGRQPLVGALPAAPYSFRTCHSPQNSWSGLKSPPRPSFPFSPCLPLHLSPLTHLQRDRGSSEVLDAVLGGRPLLCLGEAGSDCGAQHAAGGVQGGTEAHNPSD